MLFSSLSGVSEDVRSDGRVSKAQRGSTRRLLRPTATANASGRYNVAHPIQTKAVTTVRPWLHYHLAVDDLQRPHS